MLKTTLL